MAIKYNGVNITAVKYNSDEINLVKYNDTIVYENLITYTFPNASAKMTSDTSLGIKTYYDSRTDAAYSAYRAFDNNLTTAFIGNYTATQTEGAKISVVFPFAVQVQSITIKNANPNPKSLSNVGGLKTGYIYMSKSAQTNATYTDILYASLNRANPTAAGGATTHANANYASTDVRSIRISGTSWGSGTSYWHVIGDVSITFKARASDLQSWANTYDITL